MLYFLCGRKNEIEEYIFRGDRFQNKKREGKEIRVKKWHPVREKNQNILLPRFFFLLSLFSPPFLYWIILNLFSKEEKKHKEYIQDLIRKEKDIPHAHTSTQLRSTKTRMNIHINRFLLVLQASVDMLICPYPRLILLMSAGETVTLGTGFSDIFSVWNMVSVF